MYNKNIGRSLCRRRPVSMPASAGLYAGVGRSLSRYLCRYGPQGPWAQPLFDRVAELCFFFRDLGHQKNKRCFVHKIGVSFVMFAILANVDLNLRLEICKIAI